MKLSQSKYDNRSTNSSEYFKKRFAQSDLQEFSEHSSSNTLNSKIYSPKSYIIPQPQAVQIISEYQIFKPLQSISNQSGNPKINVNRPQSLSSQKKNPFLSTNYNFSTKNREDKIHQNKWSKDTFGSTKEVKLSHSSKSKNYHFDLLGKNNERKQNQPEYFSKGCNNLRQSVASRNSQHSAYKENIKQFQADFVTSNRNQAATYLNNTELIQPITLLKSSSSQGNLFTPRIDSQPYGAHFNEPHSVLEHIHFTISQESNFSKVFKSFADQQKFRINERFKQMLREIQNTLSQVKNLFERRVDQSYQLLLHELNGLKSMAELMWKYKSKNGYSPYQNLENSQISAYKPGMNLFDETNRPRKSSSKYSYKKFSQLEVPSPESNNILLNQLYEQDNKLSEYKMTKKFYFGGENDQQGNGLDRDKLLKDMYQASIGVNRLMKQCQDMFYDQVSFQTNKEKHKAFTWFNNSSLSIPIKRQDYREFGADQKNRQRGQSENINSCINAQLQQFCAVINTFRKNLSENYLKSIASSK